MSPRPFAALMVLPVAFAMVVSPAFGQDRWRPMPIRMPEQYALGLPGGEGEQHMHSMARSVSDPQVIYMSHDCAQIWRSDDGGKLWHKTRGEGMLVHAGQSIEVDPVHPNIVLAMVDGSYNYISDSTEGLYRSTDYGESWDLVLQTGNDSQRTYQHCIAYDPGTITPDGALTWYLGVMRNGLYRSDDYGVTWTLVASLASHANVYSVQAHISDRLTVYVGGSNGLYRSDFRGLSLGPWGDLPAGPVTCIAMHPTDADTMYVALQGNGLYRSTNGGANFTRIRSTDATGVFINPGHPEMIYLTSLSSALLVSSDGGATWSPSNVMTPPGFAGSWKNGITGAMSALSPDPRDADVAMGYSHASFWRTENGGAIFFDSSGLFTGYSSGWWYDGFAYDVADPDRFVIHCADVGMVITENGGVTWSRRSAPYSWYTSGQVSWRGQYAAAMYPQTGSETILGSIGMYWDCKVFRTTDAGVSDWNLVETAPENYLFIEFNTNNPNIVYAGDRRSTNGGVSFSSIAYLSTYDASIMGMCRAQPDTVYAMARPRRMIFRSDDAGVTWRLYASPGWNFNGMDSKPTFAVDPVDPDVVYTLNASGDLARYDGVTWTTLNVLPMVGATPYANYVVGVALDPRYPNIMYAQTFVAGHSFVFRSTNSGQTWEDITHNLSRTGTGAFSVHPLTGDLFFSSCYGTWVLPPPYASANSIYGNCAGEPPVARAGADFTVADIDGDGYGLIPLDGSASTAPDTGIADYQWTSGASYLGNGEFRFAFLPVGVHTVELTITDGAGLQDEDIVVVTVIGVVPGDADGDDDVDLDDFVILKTNFGMPTGATFADGDFDGDGDVDLDDFVILKTNFGV